MDDWFQREQLHRAAQSGDLALVRQLISSGQLVSAFDDLGKTPLHYAVEGEHFEIVAFLIRSGAQVDARDQRTIGNTPLGEVAGNCSLRMAQLLVEAGADPTIPGWMQLSALDRAKQRKRSDGPAIYDLLRRAAQRRKSS